MKNIKILFSAVCALMATATMAQDLNDPRYAIWGETVEARQENLLNSNFLKESLDNRNFDQAAYYFQQLVAKCPYASENTFVRGTTLYKNKINRAKSLPEKKAMVDSLMLVYDLRVKYFGDHPKRGKAYILDRKAREVVTYKQNDRAAIRKAFREAIEAAGENVSAETITLYFANLCEDYKNTDEVMPDEIIAEYDRFTPFFASHPEAAEYKTQFDAAFGLSGAASCENLEKLFKARVEAAPEDKDLLAQAVSLMTRAKCDSEFYFSLAEKYYVVKPSAETAMFLAQAFQNKGDYARAMKYLNESLEVEQNPVEREKLLVRIALVAMVSNDVSKAVSAARQANELNPEDGIPYFVLGQCFSGPAAACGSFPEARFWVAYDMMQKAIDRLQNDADYLPTAQKLIASYRNYFPTAEECFMREMKVGTTYRISCGIAAGHTTMVRAR